jgi:hypothetical protein
MKIHFAQRVMVKLVPKSSTDGSMSQNKSLVQAEANKNRLNINRELFKKTKEEREQLKIAKSQYKLKNK